MQRAEWDGIAQQFLNHKNYAAGTIEHYTASLKRYFDWCEGQGIEPEDATTGQLLLYREGLRRSLAENTANSRFKNVRSFYEYLRRVGRVHQNPTDLIQPTHIGLNARDLLTVELISYLAGRRTGYILQGTGDSGITALTYINGVCLLYTSPSPRDRG